MNNGIRIRNIEPQEITIEGAGTIAGITNVYVNGVDVTVGTKAYVIVPTKTSELTNDSGFITSYTETDPTVPAYVKAISLADINAWNDKQNELVSGVNIKTINNNSLLGSGDIQITATEYQAGTGIDITGDTISNTITSYQDLTDLPTIPTTTGELINTSGFINNTVNDLTNYIRADLLEDILPSVSDSGTELYLQDTAPYNLHLELNPSEIEQFTTTGKQLFDKDTEDYKKDYYLNPNGIEQISGNWGVYYIPVSANTDYTISGCQTNAGVNFCWFDSDKTFISNIGQKQNRTMTSPNNAGYIGLSIVWNTSSTAYDNNFMLEQGSTATDYEPYTGGIPSPNPDYPQDIHTITDENSITVINKNLFDNNKAQIGVAWNNASNSARAICLTHVEPSTQYTISFQDISNVDAIYWFDRVNENDNTYITGNTVITGTSTITTKPNAHWIGIQFNKASISQDDVDNVGIQIERGSTATSYIPHEERIYPIELDNIELTKITTQWGDYENFIFKNSIDSPWYDSNYTVNSYVYGSRVFKYTLTSLDNWQVGGGGSYYAEVNYNQLGSTKHFAISNYFQDESLVNDPSTDSWIQTLGNMIILHFNSSLNINSVDDLKTWLDNNEVIVYAIRGGLPDYNSYNQLIDYSLKSQWFNAVNSIGYDGGTTITQENFDRPFDLSAKTIQKVTN